MRRRKTIPALSEVERSYCHDLYIGRPPSDVPEGEDSMLADHLRDLLWKYEAKLFTFGLAAESVDSSLHAVAMGGHIGRLEKTVWRRQERWGACSFVGAGARILSYCLAKAPMSIKNLAAYHRVTSRIWGDRETITSMETYASCHCVIGHLNSIFQGGPMIVVIAIPCA